MNGQCSCGYRPGRISSIDCRCVTHRELNERLRKIDPNEGYYQKEIDELKSNKQDKLIAGQNITIEGSLISADLDSTNFYNKAETDELLAEKQGTLTAGENIAISEDNVISADAHMLVTLTPTGAPVGGVTDYTWTSPHTYAELVASLDKVAFKTNESGSESVLVPTELYEALESGQNVIFGMVPSNDPSVPKITNLELIVRPDGTAKATETEDLLQGDRVQFIFPKFKPSSYMGDCNIIKTPKLNIMIDCDISSNWASVRTFLDSNDCQHLDYFILSHYHNDHYGNLTNLVNAGYLDTTSTVILPLVPSTYPDIQLVEADVKAELTSAGIPYYTPENNAKETFDCITIKFGNLDAEQLETYTNYNWCSMVCFIEHKNVCAYYAGDGGIRTHKYLYQTNFINRTVNLYKQGHHGIDDNSYSLFDESISPDFVVQSSGVMDYQKNNFLSPETSLLIKNGSKCYATFMQTEDLNFQSDGHAVRCISGRTFSTSGNMVQESIYVDANAPTSAPQDGTQEHPFRELMQAITSIQNYPNSRIDIYLADGTYGLSHEAPGGSQKNTIRIYLNPSIDLRIHGNSSDRSAVVISNVLCFGSYVKMDNLTVNKDNSISDKTGIYLFNSTAYLDNVHITSLTGSKANYGIVVSEGSKLYMNNCKVEYSTTAVRNMRSSILTFDGLTTDNCDAYINNSDGYVCPKNILDQSTDSLATLKEDFTKFNCLNIQFRDSYGNRHSLRVTSPGANARFPVSVPYIDSSGVVQEQRALLTLMPDNTIQLSNKYEISYSNNSTITVTQQSSGGIRIQQVWGEFDYSQ